MTQEPGRAQGEFTAAEAGMVRRAPVTDLLAVDGESLVLLDDQVLRLGPVATVVLQLLDDGPRTQAQFVDRHFQEALGLVIDGAVLPNLPVRHAGGRFAQ